VSKDRYSLVKFSVIIIIISIGICHFLVLVVIIASIVL